VGGVYLVLVLLAGYALITASIDSQTDYQGTLSEMRQGEMDRSQEEVEFRRVTTDLADGLRLWMRNNGPKTSRVIYIGIFERSADPEVRTYYDVDIYVNPSETLIYDSPVITLLEGGIYTIQLVTERGNTFEELFRPRTEIFHDTDVIIGPGQLWSHDSYPSAYSIVDGTYVEGAVPGSLQDTDEDVLMVKASALAGTSVVFNFTGLATDSPQNLRIKAYQIFTKRVGPTHQAFEVNGTMQLLDYTTSSYATSGEGYETYTSYWNDTRWLNLTTGSSDFVDGGALSVMFNATDSGAFFHHFDLLKLDYSEPYASYDLPFGQYRTYTISVSDEVTGEARSYAPLRIYTNGSNVTFEGPSEPVLVRADVDGVYDIIIKSSTPGGEAFKLCVGLGHIAAERVIVQTA
jgi:hypothetical protein